MRIAICFSGQPRTWQKCVGTWKSLINDISQRYNAEVDIFFHAWTNNTHSHGAIVATNPENFLTDAGEQIQQDELELLIRELNPKSYVFEAGNIGLAKVEETINRNLRHNKHFGESVVAWAAPQFYGVMRAAHLKKKYEFENNFRYDICIRMRFDLYFDDFQTDCFSRCDLKVPEENTVYPCHTSADNSCFPFFRFGDILWFSDSTTYDRICDFYRWLPIIGSRSFGTNLVSTEHALYFYAKMLRMNISPIAVDPKVYRPADYIQKKIENGLPGELGGHELI